MDDVLARMMHEFELLDQYDADNNGIAWEEEEQANCDAQEDEDEEEEEEDGKSLSSPVPLVESYTTTTAVLISPRPAPGFIKEASSVGFQLPTMDRSLRQLVEVPPEVWQRPWLTRLVLSRNKIASMNGVQLLEQLPLLTSLDLSYNPLSELQLQSHGLRELRLSGCPLVSLSLSAPRLELLFLDGSRLKTCDSFSQLPVLSSLSLCGAELDVLQIPSSLTRLDVSRNRLSALPSLPKGLALLTCSHNPSLHLLPLFPSSLERCWAARCALKSLSVEGASSLTELDLAYNLIEQLDISQSTSVNVLVVSHNTLLQSLVLNDSLGSLSANNCKISELIVPPNLTSLSVSCCFELTSISPLSSRLVSLSCCFCPLLQTLPPLPSSLTSLWVSYCPRLILKMPDTLTSLVSLFISSSPFVVPFLPPSLVVLRASRCLHHLDLTCCSSLELLDVAHSPSGSPPPLLWPESDCREAQGSDWVASHNKHEWKGNSNCSGGASTVGARPTNEDAWGWIESNNVVTAVLCDGHAGIEAAQLCCDALLKTSESLDLNKAISTADEFVKSGLSSGARHAGATVLVARWNKLTQRVQVANVGDARAVLVRKHGSYERISRDHTPTGEEEERVRREGGWIENGRVNGVLGVARSVGDFYLRPAVCCIPYLSESIEIVSSSSFRLILGCDGLFDELPDALVAQLSSLKEEEEEKKSENTQIVSERLRDAAVALGSTDNISAIVIDL